MSALPKRKLTVEEYFAIERESEIRYEFIDGEIYAMSGGSRSHERIISTVNGILENQFSDGRCEPFPSNMRIKVSARKFFYADLSVACGASLFSKEGGLDHLLNPTLIVEVLSPSTEEYDRHDKFTSYKALDSLREYVLIAQHKPRIEVFTRQSGNRWLYTVAQGLESSIPLESIGLTLNLSEVYRRVDFPETIDPTPQTDLP